MPSRPTEIIIKSIYIFHLYVYIEYEHKENPKPLVGIISACDLSHHFVPDRRDQER